MDELKIRDYLDKKGNIKEDKVNDAINDFDRIYKTYTNEHHYHLG